MPGRISNRDRAQWRRLGRCDASPKFLPHDGPRLMFEGDARIHYPPSHDPATTWSKGTTPDSCQRALSRENPANRVVRKIRRPRLVSCLKHVSAGVCCTQAGGRKERRLSKSRPAAGLGGGAICFAQIAHGEPMHRARRDGPVKRQRARQARCFNAETSVVNGGSAAMRMMLNDPERTIPPSNFGHSDIKKLCCIRRCKPFAC
jgi:hypothetical protein